MSTHTKFSMIFTVIAMLCTTPARTAFAAGPAPMSGNDIVSRADIAKLSIGAVSFTAKVTDTGFGEARETRYRVLTSGKNASRVETIFPDRQRGRKLLMDQDNLWLYTPTTKRPARVSMQQRLTGEVANGDLARTNFAGDYNAKLIDKQVFNGTPVFHLHLTASRPGVTYSKIEYWVSQKNYLPVKANFYAVSGKLLKTGIYLDPQEVLGHLCITHVQFMDAVNTKMKSDIYYSSFKKEKVSDNAFNKEFLAD